MSGMRRGLGSVPRLGPLHHALRWVPLVGARDLDRGGRRAGSDAGQAQSNLRAAR